MARSYSLLVVDDEEWIRRGLVAKVRKSDLPFGRIGEAGGADDAWRIIDANVPDVVICDIRMSGTDGLELCERIARNFPDVRVIVVSGFDEFDYARRALKIGAIDYLLKPVEGYELYQALRRSLSHIDRRIEASAVLSRARNLAQRIQLRDAIESGAELTEELIREHMSDFRIGVSYFQSACLYVGDGSGLLSAVEEIIQLTPNWRTGANLAWYERSPAEAVVTLCRSNDEHAEERAESLFADLSRARSVPGGGGCTIGISSPVHSLERSIEEAFRLMRHRVLLGGDRVIRTQDVREWNGDYALHPDRIKILEAALEVPNADALSATLGDVGRDIATLRVSYACAANVFRRLLLVANEGLIPAIDRGVDAPQLYTFPNVERAFAFLEKLFLRAGASTAPSGDSHRELIYTIKEYIDAHFSEQLSLKELAARRHMNASYLSELFHQILGTTFQAYLMRTRIDQAKQLLSGPGCRMSEVAERCGFSDHNYFGKVFRRIVGLSPTEFHGRHLVQPES